MTPTSFDFVTTNDSVSIPPDPVGGANYLPLVLNNGFDFAVGNTNVNVPVNYDLTVSVYTTNDVGNLYSVLQGMNNAIGPWYRYESGTSMSAAEASGVLALIDDYFTNQFQIAPSPALMKAMLINGTRLTGSYSYGLTNTPNIEGWGQINITNSVPLTSTNLMTPPNGTQPMPLFFADQNVTNALATGDSHTFILNINTNADSIAQFLNLQATLVWTDPAGDPSAAIKLVNNLDLIITNIDPNDANFGSVYFGNDISHRIWVTTRHGIPTGRRTSTALTMSKTLFCRLCWRASIRSPWSAAR